MKPATAAKKLGVFLPATPTEFQTRDVTRSEFLALQTNPPEWLEQLRRTGPHPRQVVAQKLGISTSGLGRTGAPDSMTTSEIKSLLEQMPEWLVAERATQAAVREEATRVKFEKVAKQEQRDRGSR
jgi:uncharacterized protein DUF5997